MKRICHGLFSLLLGASALVAREGYVETYTGPIYEGHIRVQSNGLIVVNSALELRIEIPSTNVAGVTFLGPVAGSFDPPPAFEAAFTAEWASGETGSVAWPVKRWFNPVAELRSGSRIAGRVQRLDESGLTFVERPPRAPLSRASLANIRFQPLPQRAGALLSSGRTGALLANGEFIDGEFRSISGGFLVLHSVPLGVLRYNLRTEVVVAVFAPRRELAGQPCRILTENGTTWLATELAFEPGMVVLREPLLGRRRIPMIEVSELHRRPK